MDTESLRPLPSAPMAEKAVLCAVVNDTSAMRRIRAANITADHFHSVPTKTTWEALAEWIDRNPEAPEVDLIALIEMLRDTGRLDLVGGPAALADLMSYAPQAATNLPGYLQTLREMRARRIALEAAEAITAAQDSGEAIAAARDALEALQRAVQATGRAIDFRRAAKDFIARFMADHAAGNLPGAATGIQPIDEISGGMRPGELWMVGGKTSAGKSVLLLQIAAGFISAGQPVAIFSLEMMAHEVVARLVSGIGHIPMGQVTKPRTASKFHLERIEETARTIAAAPAWIDASAGQTSDTIQAEAERIRDAQGGLGLVVVDYLQLIRGGRGRGESREEEIARVSGNLKQLAKRLGCPVLSATQLNEEGKTRESRAIAHDSDALLIIEDDGIRVAKMRNGERGCLIGMTLNGAFQKFT